MKKIFVLGLLIMSSLFIFAETEYSLKKYFKDNILKLDPIEGEYSISMKMWVTPSAGESSSWGGMSVWYIKKMNDGFAIYNGECEYLSYFNIKRIGETNAYIFNFSNYACGYESLQFVFQDNVMFEFFHEFSPSTVKRQINNIHNVPLSRIHSYCKLRAIKSYPTSSMYFEAKEQATKKYNEDRVVSYPSYRGSPDLEVLEVKISKSKTTIKLRYYNEEYEDGWCSIDKNSYIRCKNSNTKYSLQNQIGISVSPKRTYVNLDEACTFTLEFPAIPNDVTSIDLIEPGNDGWKLYDINLK